MYISLEKLIAGLLLAYRKDTVGTHHIVSPSDQVAFPTDSEEPAGVSRGHRASSRELSGYYKFTAV